MADDRHPRLRCGSRRSPFLRHAPRQTGMTRSPRLEIVSVALGQAQCGGLDSISTLCYGFLIYDDLETLLRGQQLEMNILTLLYASWTHLRSRCLSILDELSIDLSLGRLLRANVLSPLQDHLLLLLLQHSFGQTLQKLLSSRRLIMLTRSY